MENATLLLGRVAIITGGGSGIGAAIAYHMSRNGASLCLSGRNETKLQNVAKECQQLSKDGKKPLVVVGDLKKRETRQKIVDLTVEKFGRINILVNNAGIMELENPAQDRLQQFDNVFDINFRAPYDLIHLAIPHLQNHSCIVNISSIVAIRPDPAVTSYCISKAALDQLTKCLAAELAPKGIRVLSINPAVTATDLWLFEGMTVDESQKIRDSLLVKHPLGRFATADEVGRMVAFFASDAASYVTGSSILIDGGAAAKP